MSLQPLRGSLATWKPGVRGTADPLHAISSAWPAIVGADVAANCVPISLANETLAIATQSSAWSQQLQFLSLTILRGIAEHAPGTTVARLAFRAGAFRVGERRGPASQAAKAAKARRRGDVAAYEPAVDLADAFERVRARIRDARRATPVSCVDCGAPLPADAAARPCTACAIGRSRERTVELERLLFAAPWLSFTELREQLPRLTVAEYERCRRRLLGRWWLVLERAKTMRRLASGALERSIASSYVLLQTRLAPDLVTPEVVSNALGPELTALLYGPPPGAKAAESASGKLRRSS